MAFEAQQCRALLLRADTSESRSYHIKKQSWLSLLQVGRTLINFRARHAVHVLLALAKPG